MWLGGGVAAAQDVPASLRCLKERYPETICAVSAQGAQVCDGPWLPWEDGRDSTEEERLDDPDLRDALEPPYPPGPLEAPPTSDPGRARPLRLMEALYGASAREVETHLVPVRWMPRSGGKTVRFMSRHGAAAALQAVSDALDQHPDPALRRQLAQTSGTFVWRTVRGTSRRSAHSFGVAIDIAVPLSDFWRWGKPDAAGRVPYKNRIPAEVVATFERHGFIWGGKWLHFDTMHFEYRPELLRCATPAAP